MEKLCACLGSVMTGAALLVCVGCSGSDQPGARPADPAAAKLVGVWKGKVMGQAGGAGAPQTSFDLDVTVEFKTDGTMTMTHLLPLSGTWELARAEGNNLTIKTVLEGPSGEISVEEKTEGGKTKRTETSTLKTEKQTQEFSIVFETDDRITMNPTDGPSEPVRLERRRSP